MSTLVLVHRTELPRQWHDCFVEFFKIHRDSLGNLGGGKRKYLSRLEDVSGMLEEYGQIIVDVYREGRKVLLVTESIGHSQLIGEALVPNIENCFMLYGRMSRRQARVFSEFETLDTSGVPRPCGYRPFVGEGFDYPPLDTLVLAMPISWKGTLQQYAGRLHREYAGKHDVRIYDYIENDNPQLFRMWEKRQRGYRAMGDVIKSS